MHSHSLDQWTHEHVFLGDQLEHVASDIRSRLETDGDRVTDLHLWQVGPGHRAAVMSIVGDHPQAPSTYKRRLSGLHNLSHLTVEVETCPESHPGTEAA